LAHGRVVNLAAADGHPSAVMDLSFASQALVVEGLVKAAEPLSAAVHPVLEEVDREVARLKLDALGVAIDSLSDQQLAYRHLFSPAPHDG
jgi:adenosylhomocysteinase